MARFSSSRVSAWKFLRSRLGAFSIAMSALVLQGFPTTHTTHVGLATLFSALPCSTKMAPFISSRSARSIPGPRGFAPMSRAQSASANTSSGSMPMFTSRSSGNSESSSSIATPSSASRERSEPRRRSATGWSWPYTSPEAILNSRWLLIWPAAPETATTTGSFQFSGLCLSSLEMSYSSLNTPRGFSSAARTTKAPRPRVETDLRANIARDFAKACAERAGPARGWTEGAGGGQRRGLFRVGRGNAPERRWQLEGCGERIRRVVATRLRTARSARSHGPADESISQHSGAGVGTHRLCGRRGASPRGRRRP